MFVLCVFHAAFTWFKLITTLLGMFIPFPFFTPFTCTYYNLLGLEIINCHSGLQPFFSFDLIFLKIEG